MLLGLVILAVTASVAAVAVQWRRAVPTSGHGAGQMMVGGVNHRRRHTAGGTFLELVFQRSGERNRIKQVELEGSNHLTFRTVTAHKHRQLARNGRFLCAP